MNKLFAILCCWACVGSSLLGQTNADTSTLLFRNGDTLNGALLAVDPPAIARWQHPDASAPIDFKLETITQVDFPTPKNSAAHSNNACRVVLADGDTLGGALLSCGRDNISLQTWYGGVLNIPRSALQSVVFTPHSPDVFDGITGMDGWTQGIAAAAFAGETGRWVYRNGAFYADKPASVARDLKLPDVAEIQFDVGWKGSLNLAIALYTDSLLPILVTAKDDGPNFGGFYSLRFLNSAFITMWPIQKKQPVRELGQLFYPGLNSKTRMHVDLRISKPKHKIALFIDNNPVKEWDDPNGFIGEGTGMRFVQNSTGPVKLSNLRVAQWDGIFDSSPAGTNEIKQDAVWPWHGAAVMGAVESITDGKLTVKTTNGPSTMPVADVRSIDFVRGATNATPAELPTARATFAEGGGLSFTLENWRPNEMAIRSPIFGQARLNPAAFTRLQFFPVEKKTP